MKQDEILSLIRGLQKLGVTKFQNSEITVELGRPLIEAEEPAQTGQDPEANFQEVLFHSASRS